MYDTHLPETASILAQVLKPKRSGAPVLTFSFRFYLVPALESEFKGLWHVGFTRRVLGTTRLSPFIGPEQGPGILPAYGQPL